MALSGNALHGDRVGPAELASGPDLGRESDDPGQRRDGRACPLDRGCLHPGLAGFRAERGNQQPHALDLRLDGRLVACGANHRRPPADRRLERSGLVAVARDVGAPRLAPRDRARVLVRVGRLSRFHVCLDFGWPRLRRSDCRGRGEFLRAEQCPRRVVREGNDDLGS